MFKSNSIILLVITLLLGCSAKENTLDIGLITQQTNVAKKATLQETTQVGQSQPPAASIEMNGVVALWSSTNNQTVSGTFVPAEPPKSAKEIPALTNQSIDAERDFPPLKTSPERNWQTPTAQLNPLHSGTSKPHENGQPKRPAVSNRAGDAPEMRSGDKIQRQGLESLNR